MTRGEIAHFIEELQAEQESFKSLARTASAGSSSRHRLEGKASGIALAILKLRKEAGL